MAKMNAGVIIAVIVGALLLMNYGGQDGATGDDDQGTIPGGCAYAPTFQIQEEDKFDSTLPAGINSYRYILNGGTATTDTDGAFEVTLGDTVTVLHGFDNQTVYSQDVKTYTVEKCGLNIGRFNGLVRNTTLTVQCFNQEGNLIDDSAENETVGAGDAVSLNCEILGASEQGIPHGGVMVVELNASAYEEENTRLTGSIIEGETSIPPQHTITNTANKAYAWDIAPIVDAGTRSFTLNFEAEVGQNPKVDSGEDVTLTLYSKDAYEDSETGTFKIGVADEDNAAAGFTVGTETVQVD